MAEGFLDHIQDGFFYNITDNIISNITPGGYLSGYHMPRPVSVALDCISTTFNGPSEFGLGLLTHLTQFASQFHFSVFSL